MDLLLMIRGAAILVIVSFIFAASPYRDREALSVGAVPSRLGTALPRPGPAEAALATVLLRGAVTEGVARIADEAAGPGRPSRAGER